MPLIRARHGRQPGCGLIIAGRHGPAATLERFHTQVLSLSKSVVVHGGAPAQQIARLFVAVRAGNDWAGWSDHKSLKNVGSEVEGCGGVEEAHFIVL